MPKANTPLDTSAPRLGGAAVAAFASHQPARRPILVFRGRITPAYSLACLRIDASVTDDAARLAAELLAKLSSDGTFTRWKTISEFLALSHFAFLSDQHCLVALMVTEHGKAVTAFGGADGCLRLAPRR
jgi:hypothetical protein